MYVCMYVCMYGGDLLARKEPTLKEATILAHSSNFTGSFDLQ